MKRRLIAAALVLVFPFGMAACGAQSKEAACKQIQKAATTASSEINFDSNSDGKDIKENLDKALKIYKKAAKKVTNKKAAKKVTNKKVKPAFKNLIADLEKFRDLADKDSSDVSTEDFQVLQDISTHGQELNDICGFKWDSGK